MSRTTSVAVLTVDQRGSRSGPDRVPALLDTLAGHRLLRPFERTAGDELQGVVNDAATLASVAGALLRAEAWYVGIGIGPVEEPLPASARAGRGAAYLHARDAVTAAKNSPWNLRVVGEHPDARSLETTLWLWAAVLARRTARGWEVADLVAEGLTYEEVGRRLGISQSAVSQRAQAAGIVEARRAQELATTLAAGMLDARSGGGDR
ncbi:sigma factor-like helix-turn-helix DNA-binding protein [Nocardioides sp. Arc9.136]|uniref:sigma factor-like helix-turn-helix DNA-binding protein n=1 Tax=Nocardioides sp. Arc9.136 TaxID=2996826 RepID=UPI0026667290|nr:sigma factor-like helix-turn-helix DNA-binding protein [Nocardioides sp. Arc9.136]WKN49978.1 transposase [Nocardioides sp. Arc9.136]